MKRIGKLAFVFFLLLVIIFVNHFAVTAHSGGTDGNGGHYNHSTGEYHYHHGHPAHQHTNGVCFYDDILPKVLLIGGLVFTVVIIVLVIKHRR